SVGSLRGVGALQRLIQAIADGATHGVKGEVGQLRICTGRHRDFLSVGRVGLGMCSAPHHRDETLAFCCRAGIMTGLDVRTILPASDAAPIGSSLHGVRKIMAKVAPKS